MADRILPFPSGNRAMAFAPTTAFPIDARTYFESYDEALSAAQEAQKVGSKDTVYHYGMKLLVNDNGVHTWYKIADDNTLVVENLGGGSGGSGDDGSSAMPTIRFCGARFANDTQRPTQIVNYDYPLKLTVEIIGGQLQVDDQLQVCERRTYWYKNISEDGMVLSQYKKQKLRRQAWYTITEEDIGQRFISIKIPNENSKIKLYHSGTMNRYDPSQSPLYLRIRRPKGNLQDNESGMTVDAEFSNIVTVWKRYSMYLGTYNIK